MRPDIPFNQFNIVANYAARTSVQKKSLNALIYTVNFEIRAGI